MVKTPRKQPVDITELARVISQLKTDKPIVAHFLTDVKKFGDGGSHITLPGNKWEGYEAEVRILAKDKKEEDQKK